MPRLASLISSAGTPRRGTPGTYPALIGTSSVIRASVSCARRSGSMTAAALLLRQRGGRVDEVLLLERDQDQDRALVRRCHRDVAVVDRVDEPAFAAGERDVLERAVRLLGGLLHALDEIVTAGLLLRVDDDDGGPVLLAVADEHGRAVA